MGFIYTDGDLLFLHCLNGSTEHLPQEDQSRSFSQTAPPGNASTHRLKGVTECPRCLGNANHTTVVTNEDIHWDWYDEHGQQIEEIINHERKACLNWKLSPCLIGK